MKAPFTVIKPFKQRSKSAITQNMFQDPNHVQEVAASTRENIEHFDFVGSQEFRTKLIAKQRPTLKLEVKGVDETTALNETSPFNQTGMSKNMFNTTINRNTMLDSLHKEQQISFGKQTRNIERFK